MQTDTVFDLLIHPASRERLYAELSAFERHLRVHTLDSADGPAGVEPHLFWFNADVYRSGLAQDYFKLVLKSSQARWLQSMAAGYESPVFRQLLEAGVRLTRSDAQARPIAEYVVSHALSLLHPIAEQQALQRAKQWKMVPFREIGNTAWMIVGFGNIGQGVAERIKPFGSRIIAVRRKADNPDLADLSIPLEAVQRHLPDVDVVVLCCGLNDKTRNLANEDFFKAMKPGSLLINIARGALVDEDALKAGLARGQPETAVLDVFRKEPLPETHWAWDHPQVRLSAHGSHFGDGTIVRGDSLFLDNLDRFLSGKPLLHEVYPDDLD